MKKRYIGPVWKALVEFDLLSAGDRILVGYSGGKDSALLLRALAVIKKYAPIPIEVSALTIDMGFDAIFPLERAKHYAQGLDVPFYSFKASVGQAILAQKNRQNPCAKCSYLRRGFLNEFARKNGFNKLALAHHYDDAVETFLMSILYMGQVKTFKPKAYQDRSGITLIRPLLFLREKEIKKAMDRLDYEAIVSPCPLDGKTKRAEVKELLKNLTRKNPQIFYNVAKAMRSGRSLELWPRDLDRAEYEEKSRRFWGTFPEEGIN